jgi:uncharacterized iron-regulated membrane protein
MLFRKSQQTRARKFWLHIHLYLGFSIGALFVMAGITGSVLVFYIEIDELLNPELVLTAQDQSHPPQTYQQLFNVLKIAHPNRDHSWRLELPDSGTRMVTARYYLPEEKSGLAFAPLQAWINPYTAEVISSRLWGDYAMTWIYDLHFSLLMDLTGRNIVAFMGICVFLTLLTGLYLWWLKRKTLLAALTFKFQASAQRKVYDYHKLSGIYGMLILLVIVVTGILLDFSGTKSIVNTLSPLYQPESNSSIVRSDLERLTLDEAVGIAQARFPAAKVKWIVTPEGEAGSYRITLRQNGEPSLRFPKTNVWVDQYSGEILAFRDVREDSAGDTFLRWLHPLHSGEAFGLTGRIIVLLSGLLPLMLFSTGLIRWIQKKRAK